MPGPLDATALNSLGVASRTQLVVDGNALDDAVGTRFTPAHPARLARGNGDDDAVVVATDPGLQEFLDGDQPPALRAAHLLAELAVIAGEQPSLARGVAFANPENWDPSSIDVDAVLRGLRNNPLLHPVTVDTLFALPLATDNDNPDAAPVVRTLKRVNPTQAPVTAAQYLQGVRDRRAIADLFNENDPRVQRADRALLSVLYRGWENPPGRAEARELLQGVGQSVHDFLGRIRTPDRSTVTLTSSRARDPAHVPQRRRSRRRHPREPRQRQARLPRRHRP